MITVKVRVYSALNYYIKCQDNHKWFSYNLSDGSTAIQLIKALKIPEKEVMILIVNGEIKNKDQVLNENDSIKLYPRLAGG